MVYFEKGYFERNLKKILSTWIHGNKMYSFLLGQSGPEASDQAVRSDLTNAVKKYLRHVIREVFYEYGFSSDEYRYAASALLTEEEQERLEANVRDRRYPLLGIAQVGREMPPLEELVTKYQNAKSLHQKILHLSGNTASLLETYEKRVEANQLYRYLVYRPQRNPHLELDDLPESGTVPPEH